MIFHVLSVPMYPTRKEITLCAFVQKVFNFCEQMTKKGHTVYHYGHPDSSVTCTQHFDCVTRETYDSDYGQQTWKEFHDQSINSATHIEFNRIAGELISEKKKSEEEFVLSFWGMGNQGATGPNSDLIVVEPSIGYDSFYAPNRVFETYTHMHRMLGEKNIMVPNWTDHVVPPGFNKDDFEFKKEKGDYLLFLGRMIDLKGIKIAQEVSKITGTPIKFVGPQNLNNTLVEDNPLAEYIHTVSVEERKILLSNAKALIAPTCYMEPCGWVMIEAFFSGTPVISTDWGGFCEYNKQGLTGIRCKNLNEFAHSIKVVEGLDKQEIRDYAVNNFTFETQMAAFENYFKMLLDIKRNGLMGSISENCTFTSPVIF
jgi:glycosyltransferase involved in cell wall biosynthesis